MVRTLLQDPSTTSVGVEAGPGSPVWVDAGTDLVAAVRSHVRSALLRHCVADAIVSQAEMLCRAVVSDQAEHSSGSRRGVDVDVTPDAVTISLHEDARTHPSDLPADRSSGAGVLDWLADEWGTRRRDRVTTIWFTLARTPAGAAPAAAPSERGDHAAAQDALVTSLQAALDRSRLLLRVTEALGAAETPSAVGHVITRTLREYLGAVFSGIALVTEDRASMRYLTLDPLPQQTADRWSHFALDRAFPVGAAALNNEAYFHATVDDADFEFPGVGDHMVTAGLETLVHVPLRAGGRTIGTLCLGWDARRELDADLRALTLIVAGYASQALARR